MRVCMSTGKIVHALAYVRVRLPGLLGIIGNRAHMADLRPKKWYGHGRTGRSGSDAPV